MEEKEKILRDALKDQDLFVVKSVMGVNHKPHQYTIGPKHVTYASDHCGGMLGEETCRKVQCAYPKCNTPYDEHTYDTVCFLQLLRNGTNDEANAIMKKLVEDIGKSVVDGFALVETDEKFRIS